MCDHCRCRDFEPIAELSAEHEEILRLAWDLAESTRGGDPAAAASLASELLALLDVHVAKEEAGLYPSLVGGRWLSEQQLASLEHEHRELRRELLEGRFDRRAFYALAAHVEVEESELFPGAMFELDDAEWQRVEGAHRAAS